MSSLTLKNTQWCTYILSDDIRITVDLSSFGHMIPFVLSSSTAKQIPEERSTKISPRNVLYRLCVVYHKHNNNEIMIEKPAST